MKEKPEIKDEDDAVRLYIISLSVMAIIFLVIFLVSWFKE